ncbi:MAG: DUF6454 family protein [Blastocatellia bacterium]
MKPLISLLKILVSLLIVLSLWSAVAPAQGPLVSQRFRRLTRAAEWKMESSMPLRFNTHHPQGMVRIGDVFYLSAVEVTQPARRFPQPVQGMDRDAGAGRGHLFKFDAQGNLLHDLILGEGTMYHPGGIDYDGVSIWVPVAEYRPNSRAIIYRVDPVTMRATEIMRYPDHLGGVVYDRASRTLHAVSWGSRWFYRWTFNARGVVRQPHRPRRRNGSFYIDYQDCKFLERGEMLCGGLSTYPSRGGKFSLGGLELIDLVAGRALHQLPLELWTESGLPMTQNPFWIEATADGLRAWFVPEDEQSTMYVYTVKTE